MTQQTMGSSNYVTQLDMTKSGGERCGEACVASHLLSSGWDSPPFDLCLEVTRRIYGKNVPGQGTNSAQLLDVLKSAYGFSGRVWTFFDEALSHLGYPNDGGAAIQQWEQFGPRGRKASVFCLIDNSHLEPRPYPLSSGWDATHWVRLLSTLDDGDMAYLYDPLVYVLGRRGYYQGPTVVTMISLRAAIQATPYPESGILVWKE